MLRARTEGRLHPAQRLGRGCLQQDRRYGTELQRAVPLRGCGSRKLVQALGVDRSTPATALARLAAAKFTAWTLDLTRQLSERATSSYLTGNKERVVLVGTLLGSHLASYVGWLAGGSEHREKLCGCATGRASTHSYALEVGRPELEHSQL